MICLQVVEGNGDSWTAENLSKEDVMKFVRHSLYELDQEPDITWVHCFYDSKAEDIGGHSVRDQTPAGQRETTTAGQGH